MLIQGVVFICSVNMTTTDGGDDASLAERRRYRTQKMQRYRKRLIERADRLKEQAATMEQEIADFMRRRRPRDLTMLLPWKEVAKAMADEREDVETDNEALAMQCRSRHETIEAMKQWAAAATTTFLMKTPRGHTQTWQHITLSAHPTTRLLGFDWITLHLYHHMDNVFRRYGFPSLASTDVVDDFLVDMSDVDALQYIWRDQREVPYPLEAVRDLFVRSHFRKMLQGDGAPTIPAAEHHVVADDDAVLASAFHGSMQYVHSRRKGEHVHYLAREFHETDRCVFVAQNILDDERRRHDDTQCHRMDWFVLDRIGPARTKMRAVGTMSHMFTKDRSFVPLEDEALRWGLDLREAAAVDWGDSVERRLIQHIYRTCSADSINDNADVDKAVKVAQAPRDGL
ncbi:Aste57867_18909 [Aphanomyces stellatus]|uniref:Aste57867_18909 protein n=1 Tax=Aphanomyces stellatus TaxID=120398 RepID=A0A485LD98_9STRA|nr:hypothetical protein As57867_018845 [Aphanomyces stellatus]VFT95641.1 Aste57867_18909 [Aphanomyces stellatus]